MAVSPNSLDFPRKPGVYLFKNSAERVLYVGKATNLKSRIRSYFSKNPDRVMIPDLVQNSEVVDFIVTNNPSEALVLERQLIREHKPKYNSMLKDDKSYPYIALTDEEFPRILYTRHPPENSRYWGPFPDAGAAKRVIQLLRSQLGIRDKDCKGKDGCLAMHIGLCKGPCLDPDGYPVIVKAVIDVLDGNARVLIESLQSEMDEASNELKYEVAAQKRDLIAAVQKTLSKQVISSRFYRDCDALGFAHKGDLAVVTVLHADDGIVSSQESLPMIHRDDIGVTVSRFICEFYANRTPPRTILTPTPIGEWLEKWLSERRGNSVEVRVPTRGDLATLRKLADQNAGVQLVRAETKQSGSLEQRAANDGAALLGLDSLDYIVCFDMAQLQGEIRVGGSIVLNKGRPLKKEFRTYRIKGETIDDLGMMKEVVFRWLKKQEKWPDLVLLDGGETHLKTIAKMLEENGVDDKFVIAALAKREETLHLIHQDPIILDKMGRVFVHARDEAHRWVNNYHRKSRNRKAISDPLESISGLGAKKFQNLIRHFGGRKGIEHASINQLCDVPGIGPALAIRILDAVQK